MAGLATNLAFLLSLMLFLSFESSGSGARIAAIARDRPDIAAALGRFTWGTRRFLVVTTLFGLGLAVLWGLLAL